MNTDKEKVEKIEEEQLDKVQGGGIIATLISCLIVGACVGTGVAIGAATDSKK